MNESSQSTNTREQTLTMRLVGQNENVKYSDMAVFWTRVWDGVCAVMSWTDGGMSLKR